MSNLLDNNLGVSKQDIQLSFYFCKVNRNRTTDADRVTKVTNQVFRTPSTVYLRRVMQNRNV